MIRKDSGRPSTSGRRPLLLTFVGNNRHMLTEIRDNLSHLRKNDSEGSELSNLHRRPELSQSTPNLLEKSAGCKMTRSDSQHHKALAEIRDSLRPYQNVCSGTANSVSGSSGVGSSDNSSSASSTSSHATSDAEHYINKVQRIMQYGFDEDVAVHALLLTRDQTVEAALRLLAHIRARSAVVDPGAGLFRASYNQPPSSLNSSGSNSVRSDSPTLTHTPQHPMLVNGLVSPPTLPPRAPITTQANQATPTFPNQPSAARSQNAIGQKSLTAQSSVLLQPLNQGRDHMLNQGRDQMLNQGRDQMLNQGRDQMLNQGRDQMLNQGRDQMLNQGRDQMLNQGRDQMLNQGRDYLADRTQDETLASGQSNIIPHGHVQQMIQRMSPGWTHQHQQQQQMTQVKNSKEARSVASQESANPLTDSKQPVIPGTSHNGINPDHISLVSQQLQNIMHDAHNFAPNSTSTIPTRDCSAKPSGQALPTSYNQARLQVAMVKGVRVTPGPEILPSTYQEPLQDFHRVPQPQGVPGKTNNPEMAQNKIMTSAGVPAMAMGLHKPVIMPCVRSKEVTKPMPQTATAPLAPPANRGITHNQFPQDKSHININPPSLPPQHQDHQQPLLRGWPPGNDFEIPITHSSNRPQIISDGRRYTLEQQLAPQPAVQPLFQQQSINQVFHNHIQALHNTTFPHEATTFTPLPDSHISRATAYSPVSVISTTSTPSTNSDVPESAPQTALFLNLRSQPHINPPLLPPRIPLKDQPSHLPANNSEQVSNFGAPPTLLPTSSITTFPPTSSSLQSPSLTKDTFTVPTSLQNTPVSLPSNSNTSSSRTNVNNALKDGRPHLTLPYPADSTPQTNESSDKNQGQNYSSAKCLSCLTQEKHRCMSPLPQRKSDARERDKLLCDTKVRVYSTQAFKFYMEQHVENVLKSCAQRMDRRLQLEKEMAKVRLSEEAADEMRKMLHKKESNYIRLKRAKMDSSMFEKIQTLGVGAFGEVALVRKKDVGSLYAMKTLKKSNVIKRNQVAHVKAERDILAEADNEWVVKLYYSFQDRDYLYFVMDYVPGGDLMGLLIRKEILEEHLARFYVAELVLAIESVHRMGFIHRDIKPDNILIDRDGHIKLTDFGLCTGFRWTHNSKYYQKDGTHSRQDSMDVGSLLNDQHGEVALKPLEQRRQREQQRYLAYSLVGTPNYIAPEVLLRSGCTKACDWWSVGVILYEMVIGRPPFYAATSAETQYKVINWKETLSFRHCTKISNAATSLIVRLLQGPETRLGRNGANEVKEHPFFADINFPGLRQQSAPLKPTIRYLTDTSNFDPVEPDNLLRNDSGGSRKFDSKLDSGKQSDHAFFEFTFRRFFDDGGHPCAVSVQKNPESNSPVYV